MSLETTPDMNLPAPSTGKRMALMLLGIFAVVVLLALIFIGGLMKMLKGMPKGEPPATVTTTNAAYDEWQPSLSAVGTLRAVKGADLAFEVAGVVTQVGAKAGAEVKQGQLLVQLNDSVEAAQLRALQAGLALAKVNHDRAKQQLDIHAISQSDYDAADADYKAKEAAVQQAAAVVAKKRLSAPFSGRVGLITTSPGAYLNSGVSVVTLQQLNPIYADFYLPQREATSLKPGQKVDLALDAFPGQTFTGKVTAVNPKVDGATRNIQVEATLSNPKAQLLPGMFASVNLEVGAKAKYLTLPQTAITYNPYGATVFIAKKGEITGPDGKKKEGLVAQQVFVTTGPTRGDQVAILKGLDEGAVVVTSGGLKLKNGTPLLVNNDTLQPSNDPHPAPQEQ
ncbi:MAG TPA: efflux RND transporter periplasmic adaptor subunit [Holophagaceae bacterium]|nr:efflux RND transporter periplasmic adaptor subunit [Holophagaceae bacterium]